MSVLFIHHRALRIPDNRGLNFAATLGPVLPLYILTDEQITDNSYFSPKSFAFLLESLVDLRQQYADIGKELLIVRGPNQAQTLRSLHAYLQPSAIVVNTDYTPYAKEREQATRAYAESVNIPYHTVWDYTLVDITDVAPQSGEGYYQVFRYFYDNVLRRDIRVDNTVLTGDNILPLPTSVKNFNIDNDTLLSLITERSTVPAGRSGAQRLMQWFFEQGAYQAYDEGKEEASFTTSMLSAHIKYGTVSIREVFVRAERNSEYARQLVWHDFYLSLMNGLPADRTLGSSNYRQLSIPWSPNDQLLQAWKEGRTGFPFIDAAMRQLAQTGWMQNRGRLAVSNFLVFGLHQNWHEGERWFAQKLVDYDVSSNNGNWQWSAQVGIDRPRSFPRVYNLVTYSKKHDPEGTYIRTWIPELANVNTQILHALSGRENTDLYLPHVVDYAANSAEMKDIYKSLV